MRRWPRPDTSVASTSTWRRSIEAASWPDFEGMQTQPVEARDSDQAQSSDLGAAESERAQGHSPRWTLCARRDVGGRSLEHLSVRSLAARRSRTRSRARVPIDSSDDVAARHQKAPRRPACHVDRRGANPLPVRSPARPVPVRGVHGGSLTTVASDAPLLERLAQLPAVPISQLLELLGRLPNLAKDPILAGLVAVDEEGQPAVHPLLA